MTAPATPLLLLAAGLSTRMRGRDKLIEDTHGQPLIRDRAQMALAAGLDVHVALPAPDHPRAAALDGLPVTRLCLSGSAAGMGGTLRDGVAALPSAPRFMILLCDLPDLTSDDLRLILAAPIAAPDALVWMGCNATGQAGHPILCDTALRVDFAMLDGDEGGRAVMRRHRGRITLVTLPGNHATRDLDTPEEWAAWRAEGNG